MPFDYQKFQSAACELCNTQHKNINGLCRHITRGHKIDLLEYFLRFGGVIALCECGKQQNWLISKMRFSGYCSRQCAATQIRKNQYSNLEYRSNISKAMKEVWASRSPEEVRRICLGSWPKSVVRIIHSDDWPRQKGVWENLDREFNIHGD